MNPIWLVAKRELKTRLLSKAAIIATLIFVVLIAGGLQAAAFFASSFDEPSTIGVSQSASELGEIITEASQAEGQDVDVVAVEDAQAKDLLREGEVDAVISGTAQAPVLLFDGSPDIEIVQITTTAAQQSIFYSAIDPEEGEAIQHDLASLEVQVEDINPQTAQRDLDGVKIVTVFAMISLLFFALIQSASLIIVGVIEEKASRVVEVLLATIRPSQLLAGKVLGIGLMALIQVLIFALAGVGSAVAAGLVSLADLNVGWSVLNMIGWFILGFGVYVALFGGLASLVSRQEDAGVVTTPMVFGMMIPFYMAIYLVPNAPDALVTKITSYIPFFAPFMMPVRMAFDSAAGWEIALAVVLCLIAIPSVIWIGARVYSRAVLHTSGRVKLRQALRA
ncbi:MAG TPA: ABC transporter permease [Beutenbergiaceae bacterium]|nr:ABC transporter permease [Beutenbergiaceae bacterium]